MEQTWRWFGPDDVVRLADARQAGATGIVTALHHIPYGVVWSTDEIERRKALIEADDPSLGLRWSVVESLPVHERIKLGEGDLEPLLDNYRQSLRNLAACGVTTVCYNFMPVLDWTRTDLRSPLPGGGRALRFDAAEFAAFDCFMLERPGAEADHPPEVLPRARAWFDASSEADRRRLLGNIMAGLPGAFDRYDIPGLRRMLDRYRGTTRDALRERLARFLRAVIPAAEEAGVRMCVHPDDPPARPSACRASSATRTTSPSSSAQPTPTPTASPSARARWVPAATTTSPPWPSGSRAKSTSPTCATSPRSPTAPLWRPTTSAATSTWCRS
jgi:mannonate dehydratase